MLNVTLNSLFLVGRKTEPDFKWVNVKGKTIIGGRKGGVPEMTLEYVLKKNGLMPVRDVNIDTSIQFALMAGAFTGELSLETVSININLLTVSKLKAIIV